jgi:hypothetical protein
MMEFSNTFVHHTGIFCRHENRSKVEQVYIMRPDHPFKIFTDQRNNYVFLLESLAANSFSLLF